MNSQEQSQEIAAFLSKYALNQLDAQTTLICSPSALYLSKNIELSQEQTDIDEVVDSLEQHQTLNQHYLLTLLSYQVAESQNNRLTVRTLYQYAKQSLQQEIKDRRHRGKRFDQQQLWAIIYSLARTLQYLESLGIAYGVLSCEKIFIDKKVKLLDPSAVGQDPFAILPHRLYSPQVLNHHATDILKSDVFVLGLCLLQAALLLDHQSLATDTYDDNRIRLQVQRLYAEYPAELASLIAQMLEYEPQNRPSFTQIRQYLQNTLQMTDYRQDYFLPLRPDSEDTPNQLELCGQTEQAQICDSEQQQQQCCLMASLNEFQKARIRFLNGQGCSVLSQVSSIGQNSRCNSSIGLDSSQAKENRRSLANRREEPSFQRRQTSKEIKNKVIKDMSSLQLEIRQVKRTNQIPPHSQHNYSHIFTSPKLMEEIQNSLKNIAINRGLSKQNIYKQNIYNGNC